ncbi:MAG: response regulator [Bacteroidota bacterium]
MKLKHVLLIDDNEIDNYISKIMITRKNLTEKISVAASAIEALEYLETLLNKPEEFPDVIFLDINMPQMDGFGFLEEYSKFPEHVTANVSVYMLTSSSDPNDIERATQNPMVKKYFSKPLTESVLNELK